MQSHKKTRKHVAKVAKILRDTPDSVEKQADARSKDRVIVAKLAKISSPVLSFNRRSGVNEFEQPEYDMAEVGRIRDVESYVQRAFSQKEGLMFKEGWELVGKNPKTIQYIKSRFEQISAVTSFPMFSVIVGLGEDLIGFSNAFLVKVRNINASGGRTRRVVGKQTALEPVAGYFPVPVSTMRFKRSDTGKLLRYRQELPNGKSKEFSPDDVIHIYFHRKKGFLVGTPVLIPVKDDIRALRRIEENIELLVYQHLFPLYHYKVGTENAPAKEYADGTREVDAVKQQIEIMPAEGMIVTPERHEVKAIGAEGRALRAEGYLQHFKQRIFAGLGVSSIDMGESDTSNRSTADTLSRNIVDDVKHYQCTLETFINEYIIKELLLESTFADPTSEDNMVYLRFTEIDVDAKIKVENHAINSFNSNAITHGELRRIFGQEPLTEDGWADTFWERIEKQKALIQAVDEPYSNSAKAAAGKRAQGAANAAQGVVTPSNQHGTKTGPEKRKSSFTIGNMVDSNNRITKLYSDLRDNALASIAHGSFKDDWFKQLALATGTMMYDKMAPLVRLDFRNGFKETKGDIESANLAGPIKVLEARVQRIVNRYVETLINRVLGATNQSDTPEDRSIKVAAVFDALHARSMFIYESERNKARNYGLLHGYLANGYTLAEVDVATDACDDCVAKKTNKIHLVTATLDDIPGFHPNCQCKIKPVKE